MSLHSKQELVVSLIMTVNKGQNSLKFDGSVMRNSLPIEMRNSSSLVYLNKIEKDGNLKGALVGYIKTIQMALEM